MTLRIRGIDMDMDMDRLRGIFTKSTIPKGEVNITHTTIMTMDGTEGRINPRLNQKISNDLRIKEATIHTVEN